MRTIHKRLEPSSLTEYRASVGTARLGSPAAKSLFDDFKSKDQLRSSLVNEQRGLCCYCLSRIQPTGDSTTIEHWQCQKYHPAERLDYPNLLGACLGKPGPRIYQHCGASKGDRSLSRNPANPRHAVEELIEFQTGDGRITSTDEQFDMELNEVLNLNAAFLMDQRREVFEGFIESLGRAPINDWERVLMEWNGESHSGELRPFCQVVV